MNLVNKVKDKWDKKKFKKLEKEVIWIQGEISKLQDQQEEQKTPETTTNSVDEKCDSVIKKKSEKHVSKKTGHDKEEEFSNTIRPDGPRKEDIKPSTGHGKGAESPHTTKPYGLYTNETSQCKIRCKGAPTKRKENADVKALGEKLDPQKHYANKRTMKRSRKRCHFCRKRGHLQKDCLSKRMLRRWLRDEAREMY